MMSINEQVHGEQITFGGMGMNLHEYQAKRLLREYEIRTPKGFVARNAKEAVMHAKKIPTNRKVIKAQIHAGGRGKAGGIVLVDEIKMVEQVSENLLGSRLITAQTDNEGLPVYELLIEEAYDIKTELYLSIILNNQTGKIEVLASATGGVNIEKSVFTNENQLIVEEISFTLGMQSFIARRIACKLVKTIRLQKQLTNLIIQMYRLFIEKDCTTLEINPLIITKENEILALDAKITIDDSALFRQRKLFEFKDNRMRNLLEIKAEEQGLSYVYLGGDVACMVNGAGLAMATMDAINHAGKKPANFLDIGGSVTKEEITEAYKMIISDSKVNVVFINIFGGIVHCNVVAEGIIDAMKSASKSVPMIVRLEGTNVKQGRILLNQANLDIHSVRSLSEGITKLKYF